MDILCARCRTARCGPCHPFPVGPDSVLPPPWTWLGRGGISGRTGRSRRRPTGGNPGRGQPAAVPSPPRADGSDPRGRYRSAAAENRQGRETRRGCRLFHGRTVGGPAVATPRIRDRRDHSRPRRPKRRFLEMRPSPAWPFRGTGRLGQHGGTLGHGTRHLRGGVRLLRLDHPGSGRWFAESSRARESDEAGARLALARDIAHPSEHLSEAAGGRPE